jgi:hypothetical protein
MNVTTLTQAQATAHQAVFTIHTDVMTEWHRKILNVQLIAREFTSQAEAQAMLDRVRKSNPKAFIKTRVIH